MVGKLNKHIIYRYSTSNLNRNKKTQFHYALKGRGSPGVLSEVNGDHMASGLISVPEKYSEVVEAFFKKWKINFDKSAVYKK